MNKAAVAGKVSPGLGLIFTCGLLAVLALVLAPAMVAHADTIEVTNTNDSGAGSLRQAIIDASIGEEITFADNVTGTITLTTGQLSINKTLTIIGPGADVLTISGNNNSRVFYISSDVTISGLTIANGDAGNGGGIYNGGTLTLNNCTASGNTATNWGGGIYNKGTLTLNNCTVSGNTARNGGGIDNYDTLTLNNCTVSGNTATNSGGGIYNNGTLTLNNSTVSDNTARNGGGIDNYDTLTLNNCTVSGNTATNWAGGIYNAFYGTLTLNNSTVSDNTADYGGGVFNYGTVTLNNCTVSNNTASGNGGGINNNRTAKVKNSIITGNNASFSPDFRGPLTSYGCNLVQDSSGCTINKAAGDTPDDTTDEDPLLGLLQDNGGPTFTHGLLEGSPAIDAVVEGYCDTVSGDLVTTDQRGEPRPADGDGDGTTLCDIGAYELEGQPPPPSVPATNQWGIVALITLFAGLLVWTVRRRRVAS